MRKGCKKIGEVENNKDILICEKEDLIEETKRIINQAYFNLSGSGIANSYINALEQSKARYGEKGVRTQILYIVANLIAKNPQQKLAIEQLRALGEGKPIPTELPKEKLNEMTEIELGQILESFEEWSRPILKRKGKLELSDFKKYAEDYGYPLDKVLVAQDWVDDCLTNEVLDAIKIAKKRVKILWD